MISLSVLVSVLSLAHGQRMPDTLIASGQSTETVDHVRIAAGDGALYCAWSKGGPAGEVWLGRSTDGGASWPLVQRVDQLAACGLRDVQVAAAGDAVYVLWEACPLFGGNLRFNRSLDRGDTWLTVEIEIEGAQPGTARDPQLVVSGSSLFVTWKRDADVFFSRSLDSGATWSAPVALNTPGIAVLHPTIAVDGSSILVAWSDTRDALGVTERRVYCNRSIDEGATWVGELPVTDSAGAQAVIVGPPRLAVAGLEVSILWRDTRDWTGSVIYPERADLYMNSSNDGGATWRTANRRVGPALAPASVQSASAHVGVDAGRVFAWWVDDRTAPFAANDEFTLYFNRSLDGGLTWLAEDREISDPAHPLLGAESPPHVIARGVTFYAVWWDTRNDVWFAISMDGGLTWGEPKRVDLGTTEGNPTWRRIDVAMSESSVHVAWREQGAFALDGIRTNVLVGILPYGVGSAGAGGFVPELDSTGAPIPGTSMSLDLTGVAGGAPAALLLGGFQTSIVSIPAFGGTLLVQPEATVPIGIVGTGPGNGSGSLPITVEVGSGLGGLNVNFQGVVLDPGSATGVVFSNALELWL